MNKIKVNSILRWAISQALGKRGRDFIAAVESCTEDQLDSAVAVIKLYSKGKVDLAGVISILTS